MFTIKTTTSKQTNNIGTVTRKREHTCKLKKFIHRFDIYFSIGISNETLDIHYNRTTSK